MEYSICIVWFFLQIHLPEPREQGRAPIGKAREGVGPVETDGREREPLSGALPRDGALRSERHVALRMVGGVGYEHEVRGGRARGIRLPAPGTFGQAEEVVVRNNVSGDGDEVLVPAVVGEKIHGADEPPAGFERLFGGAPFAAVEEPHAERLTRTERGGHGVGAVREVQHRFADPGAAKRKQNAHRHREPPDGDERLRQKPRQRAQAAPRTRTEDHGAHRRQNV